MNHPQRILIAKLTERNKKHLLDLALGLESMDDFFFQDFCIQASIISTFCSQDFCIQVPIPKLPEGGIMACSATGDEEATENPQWAVKTFDMSKFTSRDEQTMWKNLKKKKLISEKLYFKAWLSIAKLKPIPLVISLNA